MKVSGESRWKGEHERSADVSPDEERLRRFLLRNERLVALIARLSQVDGVPLWVGAGAIAQTVWNGLAGRAPVDQIKETAHGSAHVTVDLDIVYRRARDNIVRLASALEPLSPYLRGAPPGLPFSFDAETIDRGLNFTLTTAAGDLDVLGEASGGGTYEALFPTSELRVVLGFECRFVDLQTLIHLKRAAGRPKDRERIAELEAIASERASLSGSGEGTER